MRAAGERVHGRLRGLRQHSGHAFNTAIMLVWGIKGHLGGMPVPGSGGDGGGGGGVRDGAGWVVEFK